MSRGLSVRQRRIHAALSAVGRPRTVQAVAVAAFGPCPTDAQIHTVRVELARLARPHVHRGGTR